MTSNPITLDKEYQTRDGRPARVYATDIGGNSGGKSVLATYQLNGSTWLSIEYFANGRVNLGKESDLDLIEKPRTYKDAATCEGREIEIDGVTYVLKLKGQDDE